MKHFVLNSRQLMIDREYCCVAKQVFPVLIFKTL